jgi:hypothetical protein
MPYEDAPLMARVEELQDVKVLVGGEPLVIRRGFRYSCTRVEAYELARAGYVRVRPTEPDTAPEIEGAVMETGEQATLPVQRKRRGK